MPTHWDATKCDQEKWRIACSGPGAVGVSMAMSQAFVYAEEANPQMFMKTGYIVTEDNKEAIAQALTEGSLRYDDKPLTIEKARQFVGWLVGYRSWRE